MCAYFALEIGFRHPDLFGKVGAFDPALPYSDFSGQQFE
jgi:esterase/lipase superfamily enzyme